MLCPEIKRETIHRICPCGKQNFRSSVDHKDIYNIYRLRIPTTQWGVAEHYLCEDCLKSISNVVSALR